MVQGPPRVFVRAPFFEPNPQWKRFRAFAPADDSRSTSRLHHPHRLLCNRRSLPPLLSC